jgi:hypothetical protein
MLLQNILESTSYFAIGTVQAVFQGKIRILQVALALKT